MFPGTLAVAIAERQPIGIGRIRGTLYLIDRTGAVIDEFGPNYSDLDLPIVDGLATTGGEGESVDEARSALAGRLMSDLERRPELAARVSQIDVTDARNALVILKNDTALLRLGDERFAERLQSYIDLMPALRERMSEIDYVDLRFDERVYVRQQTSRARASVASSKQARQAGRSGRRSRPARRGAGG
jgi:cell division septal protein FtsQ